MFRKTLIIALTITVFLGIFTAVHAEVGIPISYAPYEITESGLYYLTKNLVVGPDPDGTVKDGISVLASNVTIDLMGHSIIAALGGCGNSPFCPSLYGIGIFYSCTNVEIKNGTVADFYAGGIGIMCTINSPFGPSDGVSNRVINVKCMNSGGGPGIWLLSDSLVKNCIVQNNYGSGIIVGDNSIVRGNTVRKNNISEDINSAGIYVNNDCLVKDNVLNDNKQSNILVNRSGNNIEENLLLNSDQGIYFTYLGVGNFYANNRASKCTNDYVNTMRNTDGGGNASF